MAPVVRFPLKINYEQMAKPNIECTLNAITIYFFKSFNGWCVPDIGLY